MILFMHTIIAAIFLFLTALLYLSLKISTYNILCFSFSAKVFVHSTMRFFLISFFILFFISFLSMFFSRPISYFLVLFLILESIDVILLRITNVFYLGLFVHLVKNEKVNKVGKNLLYCFFITNSLLIFAFLTNISYALYRFVLLIGGLLLIMKITYLEYKLMAYTLRKYVFLLRVLSIVMNFQNITFSFLISMFMLALLQRCTLTEFSLEYLLENLQFLLFLIFFIFFILNRISRVLALIGFYRTYVQLEFKSTYKSWSLGYVNINRLGDLFKLRIAMRRNILFGKETIIEIIGLVINTINILI